MERKQHVVMQDMITANSKIYVKNIIKNGIIVNEITDLKSRIFSLEKKMKIIEDMLPLIGALAVGGWSEFVNL